MFIVSGILNVVRAIRNIFLRKHAPSAPQPSHNGTRLAKISLNKSDVIIAVLGLTGSGKSTLINKFCEANVVQVGEELTSCTSEVYPVALDKGPRRYVFVDTPGFDDTYLSDVEILERVARWLKTTYSQGIMLTGVIFTLNISAERLPSVSDKILDVMRELCGNDAAAKLVFVPTMTDQLDDEALKSRLDKIESDAHVAKLIALGARWSYSKDPWKAIEMLCPTDAIAIPSQTVLQIQEEMVDSKKKLRETRAAGVLLKSTAHRGKTGRQEIRGLSELMRETGDLDQRFEQNNWSALVGLGEVGIESEHSRVSEAGPGSSA